MVLLLPAVFHTGLESTEIWQGRTLFHGQVYTAVSLQLFAASKEKPTSETFLRCASLRIPVFTLNIRYKSGRISGGVSLTSNLCPFLTLSSSFLTLMIHLSDLGCKVFFFLHFSLLSVCENVVQHKSPSDAFLRRLKDALHTQMLLPYAGFSNFLDESIFFRLLGAASK